MSEYVLEMSDVSKLFPGVKALDHAQLKLRPGKVHALMGENGAGKSTLMKCMFGIYKMDEGQIKMDGQPVTISDPMDALKKGIAMVHQELQPIPARTVGENIFLGRYPMKKALGFIPVVDHKKMYDDTARLLKRVRMNFDPKQKVGELSVSQMQSVEIAKAVSANCRVLILDEPTSSLTANEVEAAHAFIDWMLSDTCQEMATNQFYRYPISKNVPVNPAMIPMDQLNLIDYDFIWSGDHKVELVERFEREVRTRDNVIK